jgi:dTDP-4-amino-4,6-dideoxygalactose transaminase
MTNPARGIESFFRRRYGREALYVPSGRLALYLAFREWLRPGDRILISPVNDDVVFFTVLAAGLVPVLGPLDPATGNLDASALDANGWSRLQAVMTTSLYGIPDRMDLLEERCRRHGLLLIEDACQALDSGRSPLFLGEGA